jgi:hypothetical protein
MNLLMHFKSSAYVFALPLALAAASGCSVPTDEAPEEAVSETQAALSNAPLDATHKFNVGVCLGTLKADGTCKGSLCSGTLVAPNVVLTAQHCIYDIEYADTWCGSSFTDQRLEDAPVRITTSDSTVVGSPKWYEVKDVLVPAKNLCHDDIALLILSSHVPVHEAFPVAMSLSRDIDQSPPSEVAVVGRGSIDSTLDLETFEQTSDDGDLKRRILEHIPLVCAPGTAAGCDVEDYTSPPTNTFNIPSSMFAIGRALEGGDSGTGIFDQRTFNWFPSVIGVATATTFDANGKSKVGLITRIDTHRAFILEGMFKAWGL